jgi:hypothetical protein
LQVCDLGRTRSTPQVRDILLTSEAAPNAARDTPVRSHSRQQTAALCALLEEGIVNVKAIDPTQRAGVGSITHVSRVSGFPLPIRADRDRPARDG